MIDLTPYGTVAGLAVLIGILVQVFKSQLNKEGIPYVAMALGVVLALLIGYARGQVVGLEAVINHGIGGLLAGLLAVGGYEASIQRIKNLSR